MFLGTLDVHLVTLTLLGGQEQEAMQRLRMI